MDQIDQRHKKLVFCATQDHAAGGEFDPPDAAERVVVTLADGTERNIR